MTTALVVGGTGPSGPELVRVLLDAGYRVTVLHRGTHEPDEPMLREVEHLHADPHFADTLRAGLGPRTFDLVVATYGRMAVNVEVLAGRCGRFVGVGGNPLHPGLLDASATRPSGMRILASERDRPVTGTPVTSRQRFAAKVAAAEQAVLDAHAAGAFVATYLRYPTVYGPRAFAEVERSVVRRLRAGRRRLAVPEGGLAVTSRLADRNAAEVLRRVLAVPEESAGRVFQCADDEQYCLRQWIELIADAFGAEVELISVPTVLASAVAELLPTGTVGSPHVLVDTFAVRSRLGYQDAVRPRDVLGGLVARLAEDPATAAPRDAFAAEDALLAAMDRLAGELGADRSDPAFGGRREPFRHQYDHPAVRSG